MNKGSNAMLEKWFWMKKSCKRQSAKRWQQSRSNVIKAQYVDRIANKYLVKIKTSIHNLFSICWKYVYVKLCQYIRSQSCASTAWPNSDKVITTRLESMGDPKQLSTIRRSLGPTRWGIRHGPPSLDEKGSPTLEGEPLKHKLIYSLLLLNYPKKPE